MFWVVQENLFQQNERPALLAVLRQFAVPHQIVSVAHDEITPDVIYDGPIIINGSVMLSNIAVKRGWKPGGVLLSDNFSYEVWHPHLRQYLLNRDAVFTTIAQADPPLERVFVRPLKDDKAFTGRVMTIAEFRAWQAKVVDRQGTLDPDTPIIYAPVRHIGQEHRHFIVDGDVISSSRYKLGGVTNQSASVDAYIIEFAARMAAIWQPARAFVLDTYVTDDEIGVVELGGICYAGFYQADVQKIVMALDGMSTI